MKISFPKYGPGELLAKRGARFIISSVIIGFFAGVVGSYLLENHFIQSIQDYNEAFLPIFSREVLAKIQAGDSAWEIMVPPQVAHIIKQRTLFGYRSG